MKTITKLALAAALVGTLGLAGLARNVSAKQAPSLVAVMPQHQAATKIAEASDGDGETDDDKEELEAAKLQPLAKITPEQAKLAAETAQGKTASSVKLEDEDGNLVYAVKIGKQEVKVDAGNGKVLYIENEDQEDEKNEASRPKSSIQIPQNNGERETNENGK